MSGSKLTIRFFLSSRITDYAPFFKAFRLQSIHPNSRHLSSSYSNLKMKIFLFIPALAMVSLLAATGCQTTQLDRDQREQWESALSRQVINLEKGNAAFENQVDELRRRVGEIEKTSRHLQTLLQELSQDQNDLRVSLQNEVRAQQAVTNKKLDVILEEVAKENEKLLARIQASRAGAATQGYEHVVKPGETISGIARHYGVTADAIVSANQLSDPHAIRVGQILFVPR